MGNKEEIKNTEEMEEEIKKLVINRLEVLPPDKKISIGSEGEYTKDDLIKHVKEGDRIGKKITEIQLEYLRLLKEGIFYEQNLSNNEATI